MRRMPKTELAASDSLMMQTSASISRSEEKISSVSSAWPTRRSITRSPFRYTASRAWDASSPETEPSPAMTTAALVPRKRNSALEAEWISHRTPLCRAVRPVSFT